MSNEAMTNKANAAIQNDKEIVDELSAQPKSDLNTQMIDKLNKAMQLNKDVIAGLGGGSTQPGGEPDQYVKDLPHYEMAKPISYDGVTNATKDFTSGKLAMATFKVPGNAKHGPQTVALFEHGTPPTSMRAWISKTKWDTSHHDNPLNYQTTQGPVFQYSIGEALPDTFNVQPGETFYIMFAYQKPFPPHEPSVPAGQIGVVGIRWYPVVA